MKPSKRYEFNKADVMAWVRKAIIQLLPVFLLYLSPIIAELNTQGHVFSLRDFIPTNFVIGGMVLYVLNRIYDAIQRLIAGKK